MPFSFFNKSIAKSDNRQVISIPIDDGITCLRGLSPKRLRFELEYSLEKGSTINSFLFFKNQNPIYGDSPILIHPPGDNFSAVFLPALTNALPKGTQKIVVIVSQVNPNRIGLLKKLAKAYSEIEFISSNPGAKLLKELWELQKPSDQQSKIISLPKIRIIKKEEVITLTDDCQLHLMATPTARWPGVLIAFEKSLGLLMSDKLFGAHLYSLDWAESNRISTEEERRHYFDCLIAPMSNQIDSIVERLEVLDIQTIAPCHGPAIDDSWRSLLNDYQRWGVGNHQINLNVLLIFASAYGNTAAIADALAKGINKTGIKVKSLNCELSTPQELINDIRKADAYLIGSPTLGGHAPTPIVSALGTLLAEGDRTKPIGIFGSYGWSGEALELLETKLLNGGFNFGFAPIKIKFSPDFKMIQTLEETGTQFGRKLLRAEQRQQKKAKSGISASQSDPTILALGRIVGSLCVLTAQKGQEQNALTGAMVASWISQASFVPPGLTIAVAKDRAVEALLHSGDHFALNVLAAGREKELMRQFLQPFSPGSNRFEGLSLETTPKNQPILPKALAWLEASVQQRMECGDHWLIYAQVNCGGILDSKGITAIHHRKTGANY